jgi:HK97 family phage prohead protease
MEDKICRAAVRQTDADPFEYVMSDESVDRMGEVIQADGWDLATFKTNPIGLFNHHADAIIGRWEQVRVIGKQLRARFVFADEGTSEIADTARKLWNQKILRGASVGFRPLKREPLTRDADEHFGPFRYLKQQLLECSLVAVPANANALPVLRSFHLLPEISRQIFGKPASQERPVSRVPAKPPTGGKQMSLSKRIEAAQHELLGYRDQLAELSKIEDPDDDQVALIDELNDRVIPSTLAAIERMEKTERSLAAKTADPQPQSGEIILPDRKSFALPPKKKPEPGDYVYRALAAWASAQTLREPLEKQLQERYQNDETTGIVLKAAVNPAMTTVAGWAAELTQAINVGFLDRLIPDSVYPRLAARGNRYTFGNNNQLKIPTRTTTTTLAGAWVGEGAPKPVRKASFSSITLTPFKLAVISTFSEEMALYSTPAIEGIIRQAMQDDTAISLDTYLIDNVAASAVRPAGLLNGVTPLTATAAGTRAEKMVADLQQLANAIIAAGGGSSIVYLVNPAQMLSMGLVQTTTGDFLFSGGPEAAARFNGASIIASLTVPAGTVIAIDASEFATATGDAPRFAVSNEATLHEEDTTPLALSATGSPNTVAAPMRSLFQTDTVAIRMTLYVTWKMRRTGMVQTVASVGW